MRHILLSGGVPPVKQWDYYLELISAIRTVTNLPLYQMIVPPSDLTFLDELHQVGVDEIGFNMEIVEPSLSQKIMPGKGKLPREMYLQAMEYAVNLWGSSDGQVRSALIVGLEPLDSTLEGVELFAQRGVMPILSPFRPVPTTPMSHFNPARPELMMEAWQRGQEQTLRYNQVLGPTCIGCQNNTISMPVGPQYRYY